MPARYDRKNPPMVSAELLLGSLEAARELGVDLTDTLAASEISVQHLQSGDGYLPLHKVVEFLNDAAERFKCEHFGFLVGKNQPPARFAMVGQLICFAATLEGAIEDAMRFALLNSEYSEWTLERDKGLAMLVRRTRVAYDAPIMQIQTLAVVLVYKAIVAVCGRKVPLRQVQFTHRRPARSDRLEAYFGAPVRFNQNFTGLVFAESELRSPIPTRDANVHRLLTAHLASLAAGCSRDEDLVTRVRHHIKQTVGSRHCNLDGICLRSGIHPRALQRALREQRLTFRQLLHDVRQELAEDYFRNSSLSVLELTELLGYSNASAFSRAFKQRTGMSPQQWKERHAV
jgi:AraC-like DNA-binding protein